LGQVAWQFDMSDSVISFIGGGVAEGTHVPLQWSLSVSPNPARGAFTVRYDVPGKWGQSQPLRGQTEVQSPFSMSLGIYDVGGRLVRSLSEGAVAPGRYETRIPSGVLTAGVYFVRLEPWAVSRYQGCGFEIGEQDENEGGGTLPGAAADRGGAG
jgi:hypothetical protein